MRAPRWLDKLYAKLFGYFWLPCPICKKEFGGHEKGTGRVATTYSSRSIMTCPECPGDHEGLILAPAGEEIREGQAVVVKDGKLFQSTKERVEMKTGFDPELTAISNQHLDAAEAHDEKHLAEIRAKLKFSDRPAGFTEGGEIVSLSESETLELIDPVESVEDAIANGLAEASFKFFGTHMTVEIVKRHLDAYVKTLDGVRS